MLRKSHSTFHLLRSEAVLKDVCSYRVYALLIEVEEKEHKLGRLTAS